MIAAALDALLVDVGGTLVEEAAPGTAVSDLLVVPLPRTRSDLQLIAAEIPVIAVTNTSVMLEADVLGLLGRAGLAEYLAGAVTSAEVGVAKPDPAPLRVALARLGLTRGDLSRVLFIGDLPTDEEAALAAGVGYAEIQPGGLRETVLGWVSQRAGQRFESSARRVAPPDKAAAAAAAALHASLTKPPGALGALEDLGVRLAGMYGQCPPPLPRPAALAIFAGDHGVVAEGVTAWPSEVTGQMLANFCLGGAAANVLARQHDVRLTVVDVGVNGARPDSGVTYRRVARGTANLAIGPAMTGPEVRCALDVGVEIADRLVASGAACLLAGEMGIGNTTPAAALLAVLTGASPEAATGRGAGLDTAGLDVKRGVVASAVERARDLDAMSLLAEVGGLELAALAGFIVGAAAARVPVILDGVITVAAGAVAQRLSPGTAPWCIAGHKSPEPGARLGLDLLGLRPMLELGLRLGEGTGALAAFPLVETASRVLREMATFDSAGISSDRRS